VVRTVIRLVALGSEAASSSMGCPLSIQARIVTFASSVFAKGISPCSRVIASPRVIAMTDFLSYDATLLSYRYTGVGESVVCLPGGPGRSADYLGDLGGLAADRRLVLFDPRGTGSSAVPAGLDTMRADRLVDDVEALRLHLGMDQMDLLAHSAAGNVAILYAARHPHRVRRLTLLTPGSQALGVEPTDEEFLAAVRLRAGEPWYPRAYDGALALLTGDDSPATLAAVAPLNYGRFDAAAAAHAATTAHQTAAVAAAQFFPPNGFATDAVRTAVRHLAAPVLVYAGTLDVMPTAEQAAELADLFPHGTVTVQPDAGHHPWLDDGDWFVSTIVAFLADTEAQH
jgi:pimeloyl-ACP methyl ester carboxylesterase